MIFNPTFLYGFQKYKVCLGMYWGHLHPVGSSNRASKVRFVYNKRCLKYLEYFEGSSTKFQDVPIILNKPSTYPIKIIKNVYKNCSSIFAWSQLPYWRLPGSYMRYMDNKYIIAHI